MARRVALYRVRLSYADGLVLYTASSGAVPVLDELRLVVKEDGAVAALGATRVNIEYLSGLPPEDVVAACLEAARAIDWSGTDRGAIGHDPAVRRAGWERTMAALDRALPTLPAPARMLFEMAGADGAARAEGVSLAAHLAAGAPDAGPAAPPAGDGLARSLPTNQTLFRSDDAELLRRADAYVRRGFRDLKLRVGFGQFDDDLRRLRLLRDRHGPQLSLSIDANGRWSEAEAARHLAALEPLALRYVEQPIPPGDWDAVARVARATPIPIMLDESLSDMAAVERLAETRAAALAHLKLAKLGGLDRLMRAGRRLAAAGIPVMVGQMNEGTVSTLAAAHAAAALGAAYCELYGGDGLAGDPSGTLRYAEGRLDLPAGPGLGLHRHDDAGILLWERNA